MRTKAMEELPHEVKEILKKFTDAGFEIYIVGGAVRDLLMGKSVYDWDFTTDAKPEEILKLYPEGFYDNKFGTVGIPSNVILGSEATPESDPGQARMTRLEPFEITTMRKERNYKDFRHPEDVSWTDKIEEDLGRRDFTINAMALGLKSKNPSSWSGNDHDRISGRDSTASLQNDIIESPFNDNFVLIDPYGGQTDLEKKMIKAVGDPNKRFKEDTLRLMRAIRIATQLEFEIEKNTFGAIQKNAELIKEVSTERIRDELLKLLGSVNPRLPSPDGEANGGQAYIGIMLLREAGILQIILPEVEKTFGIVQEGPKHARIYDIGQHSLLTLKETVSSDPITKLAALLHDIGKPDTYKIEEDGNSTFYNHEVAGGKLALGIAKRLHLSKKQTDKLYRLVRWHLFTVDENQTDASIRRFIKNVGVENLEDMMALRVGDRLGGGTEKPTSWRTEKFKERIHQVLQKPFSITDLKVNGKDVMEILKLKPGPEVGKILNKLFQEVLEDSSKNNREYLLNRIKQLK